MAEFPLEPQYSKVVIQSQEFGCTSDVISIVSMLSVESIFLSPKEKKEQAEAARKRFISWEGDHITLLNVYKGYIIATNVTEWCWDNFINLRAMKKVLEIRKQIVYYCNRLDISLENKEDDVSAIKKSFITGFFNHIAILKPDGQYKSIMDNKIIWIHPTSVLFGKKPECLLYNELVLTTKQYIREVLIIDAKWLELN